MSFEIVDWEEGGCYLILEDEVGIAQSKSKLQCVRIVDALEEAEAETGNRKNLYKTIRDARKECAALRGVIREVETFVLPLSHSTEYIDTLADRFYRDTGMMAPGKSVALEMANSQPSDEERRKTWADWIQAHRAMLTQAIRNALAGDQGGDHEDPG